jgi:hypothetical protein
MNTIITLFLVCTYFPIWLRSLYVLYLYLTTEQEKNKIIYNKNTKQKSQYYNLNT